MQPSSYRLGFRGDIEGLRAVAILLVVAAHARVALFAGGFVGVDVFFVLSGYLITGLLMQEVAQKGTLNFADFYARRLRRLMPGLLLMVACVALLGHLLAPASEQPTLATAATSAVLWISNFFFAFARLDYFSPGSETNLFLHTWSLGVEEQFYLIWPLLLVLTTGAWTGARTNVQRVRVVMPLVFVASLALCAFWNRSDPALAFYTVPTRAWQFALGALTFAFFGSPRAGGEAGALTHVPRALTWLGWLGLAAIIAAGIRLGPNVSYPWPWALIPSFGAAAVLASGAHAPAAGAGALLSTRPLQAIGRVSYSWYLWHWPVFLIGALLINTESGGVRLMLAALSLLLAAAAYWYVEVPIRRQRVILRFPRAALAAGLLVMALAAVLGVKWNDAAQDRMHQPDQMRFVNLLFDSPVVYGLGCDDWYKNSRVNPCKFGRDDAPHTAVIIGDSVALQWFPAFSRIFSRDGWRIVALTKSACPMVDVPIFYERIRRVYTECETWRADALRQVARMKPDIVLLGSTYSYDYTPQQWIEGTKGVLRSISGDAGHVYILRSTPRLPFDAPTCLAPRSALYRLLASNSDCTATARIPQSDAVFGWLGQAAQSFPNVSLVDMTESICPNGMCRAERNGTIVFRDSQHLTTHFVESLTSAFAAALASATPQNSGANEQGQADPLPHVPKSPP